jgi:uncharacterized protein
LASNDIWNQMDKLANLVYQSGFKPDLVVAIARGGIPAGVVISKKLGVPMVIVAAQRPWNSLKKSWIKNFIKRSKILTSIFLYVERMIQQLIPFRHVDSKSISASRILLVDDAVDTGNTIKSFLKNIEADNVKVAAIKAQKTSAVKVDFSLTSELHIIFPWSIKDMPPIYELNRIYSNDTEIDTLLCELRRYYDDSMEGVDNSNRFRRDSI